MSVAIYQSKQSASTPRHNIAVYCAEGKYRLLLMLYFFFHVEIVSLTTTVLRRVLELKYRRHSMYGRSWYSTVASKENNGRKAADHDPLTTNKPKLGKDRRSRKKSGVAVADPTHKTRFVLPFCYCTHSRTKKRLAFPCHTNQGITPPLSLHKLHYS